MTRVMLLVLVGLLGLATSKAIKLPVYGTKLCFYDSTESTYDFGCTNAKSDASLLFELSDSVLKLGDVSYYVYEYRNDFNDDEKNFALYKAKWYDSESKVIDVVIVIGDERLSITIPQYSKKSFQLIPDTNYYGGSGFGISDHLLVTNYHVIENMKVVYVMDNNKLYTDAKVKFIDPKNDLAVLQTTDKIKSCKIDDSVYDVGTDIYVFGYPRTSVQGVSIKATKGIISSRFGYNDDIRLYQIDAAIQSGNSGGPLVRNDRVIGVIVSTLTDAQNVNYAIKSAYLVAMLKSVGLKNTSQSNPKDCTYFILGKDK